jgi:hypothetical protein
MLGMTSTLRLVHLIPLSLTLSFTDRYARIGRCSTEDICQSQVHRTGHFVHCSTDPEDSLLLPTRQFGSQKYQQFERIHHHCGRR